MIKEYFTDGLIGLAILLSLFRTDLNDLNINNLINYPEVQDIIQGQTAVYLPANFHSNSIHAFSHPKLRDREALIVWYRNFINLPFNIQHSSVNEIEAFLLSGSQRNIVDPSLVNNQSSINITTNENIAPVTTVQTLPQESANSYSEPQTIITEGNSTATSSTAEDPLAVDVSFLFNCDGPFPNCNLTTEDLSLIELLWKQDVDLGVGKEVYDQSLREELEKQRQVEYYKQEEERKAREKEERSKQEEASRWLNQNFMRDGETGEWVKRQNKTDKSSNGSSSDTTTEDNSDDFLTLEAALDYISSNVGPNDFVSNTDEVADSLTQDFQRGSENNEYSQGIQTLVGEENMQQFSGLLSQDSLEHEWTEVEQYLNISLTQPQQSTNTGTGAAGESLDIHLLENKPVVADLTNALETNLPRLNEQTIFTSADLPLIQDAPLPSVDIGEPAPELGAVTLTNSSVPPPPIAMNTSLDWDLENITLFSNLTALQEDNVDDLDLQGMEDLFNTMTESSELLTDAELVSNSFNESSPAVDTRSFTEELNDTYDGLEGATGGVNYNSEDGLDAPYNKISRLSESSTDSGFSGKGFSSSSSSPSSSYAGSPSDSGFGNSSTNSNDTEHDPKGSRVLAQQVAHNHTYNTLPGHVPREVKKYAPKENTKKGPQCRDQKKAQEMKIPLTIEQIVESPVELFNDILTKHSLTEEQLTLIRDIRRRGKNKLAAQNCRKRKVGVIVDLSDEMGELHKVRDRLKAERAEMERETRRMKEKFGHLYTHIFQSLRDEHGQPYDTNQYSLQQSSDGNVFLVPRNVTSNSMNDATNTTTNGTREHDINRSKKRRSDH